MYSSSFNSLQSNNPQNHTVHLAAFKLIPQVSHSKNDSTFYHPQYHSTGAGCILAYVTSTVVHFRGLSEMLCGISEGVGETALPLGTILITSSVYLKGC